MAMAYDLSWGTTSFPAKLLLLATSHREQRRKIKSMDVRAKAEGYSALSSTYYSIAGTAGAHREALHTLKPKVRIIGDILLIPRFFCFMFTWLPLGGWCWWRMLYLSDQVERLIGLRGMSAARCDIRQSILRARCRFYEARVCIESGLRKEFSDAHTKGLLHCGMAEILRRDLDRQGVCRQLESAIASTRLAEQTDPRQAARIYRQCASLAEWLGLRSPLTATELYQKAEVLAIAADATDQLLKMRR